MSVVNNAWTKSIDNVAGAKFWALTPSHTFWTSSGFFVLCFLNLFLFSLLYSIFFSCFSFFVVASVFYFYFCLFLFFFLFILLDPHFVSLSFFFFVCLDVYFPLFFNVILYIRLHYWEITTANRFITYQYWPRYKRWWCETLKKAWAQVPLSTIRSSIVVCCALPGEGAWAGYLIPDSWACLRRLWVDMGWARTD